MYTYIQILIHTYINKNRTTKPVKSHCQRERKAEPKEKRQRHGRRHTKTQGKGKHPQRKPRGFPKGEKGKHLEPVTTGSERDGQNSRNLKTRIKRSRTPKDLETAMPATEGRPRGKRTPRQLPPQRHSKAKESGQGKNETKEA